MKILILWRSFICSLTFFQILPLHFHNIVNDIYNVLSSLEKNQEKMTEKWGSLFLPQGRTDVTAVTDQSRKDRGDTGEGPGPHLIFRPKWGQKKIFFGDQAPPISISGSEWPSPLIWRSGYTTEGNPIKRRIPVERCTDYTEWDETGNIKIVAAI